MSTNNTLESLRIATELIRLGIDAIVAVKDFIAWFREDPEAAARIAREKKNETAAGWAKYHAAKNAGPPKER